MSQPKMDEKEAKGTAEQEHSLPTQSDEGYNIESPLNINKIPPPHIANRCRNSLCLVVALALFVVVGYFNLSVLNQVLIMSHRRHLKERLKTPPLPPHFCIIHPSFPKSVEMFERQLAGIKSQIGFPQQQISSFFMVNESSPQYSQIEAIVKRSNISDRVTLERFSASNGTFIEARNVYAGVMDCPDLTDRRSFAIIMKDDEVLASNETLKIINQSYLSDEQIHVVLTPIQQGEDSQSVRHPSEQIYSFNRVTVFGKCSPLRQQEFLRTKDLTLVRQVLDHTRVFSTLWFRFVPYIQLMSDNETFYDTFLSFQLPLLEFGEAQYESIGFKLGRYLLWNYVYELPLKILEDPTVRFRTLPRPVTATQPIVKILGKYHQPNINLYDTLEIGRKVGISTARYILIFMYSIYYKPPPHWQYPNYTYNALQRKIPKDGEDLIPLKIHQIWIGGEMPPHKVKYMNRMKQLMPHCEYILWKNENLTRENFPLSYDKIQEVLQLHKTFHLSRISVAADIMKYQILLRHGGFYFDTNYEVLKDFTQIPYIRKYPLVLFLEEASAKSVAASMLFAAPNNPYIAGLLTNSSLQSVDPTQLAFLAASGFFLGTSYSYEDYFYRIKVFPGEIKFYPCMPWVFDSRIDNTDCKSLDLFKDQKHELITYRGIVQAFPCSVAYPEAYGIDHFELGGSWASKNKHAPAISTLK